MRGRIATWLLVTCVVAGVPGIGHAQEPGEAGAADTPEQKAGSLTPAQLREQVRAQLETEAARQRRRVEEFEAALAEQKRLLADAKRVLEARELASRRLEELYAANESQLAENQERLEKRLAELGELFGVVRQVATDASGHMFVSLTSAQLGTRKTLLERLGRSTELPSTRDLQRLWFELQREMTEQGQIVRFRAPVLSVDGEERVEREVVRAGPFIAVSGGRYLYWKRDESVLAELARQPPPEYTRHLEPFESNTSGFVPLAVDPSRGVLLEALTETPSVIERLNQGKTVGYVILTLGCVSLLIGLVRWWALGIYQRRVAAQQAALSQPRRDNPLGRLLVVADDSEELDSEHLEVRLEDALRREAGRVNRYLWIVRTASVIAPLLGLLGTVTGMIQTFQAITLFGAGDPRMMAGGISEALVTTMLGLITAIPLVLLYETLSNGARGIVGALDEQVVRLVAARAEREHLAETELA